MSDKNQKIGTWTCEQGGDAEVFQTVKRGRHFYTRCECCGLNQGTGVKRQQRIFDEAKFLDKSAVFIPSGVSASGGVVIEQEPVKKSGAPVLDFDPNEKAPEEIVQSAPVQPADKPGFARFLPGVILLAAAGVGLWMN